MIEKTNKVCINIPFSYKTIILRNYITHNLITLNGITFANSKDHRK